MKRRTVKVNIGIIALNQRMIIYEKILNSSIVLIIIVKAICLQIQATGNLIKPFADKANRTKSLYEFFSSSHLKNILNNNCLSK